MDVSRTAPPTEMDPQRWGPTDCAEPLAPAARGLVELAFGLAETPPAPLGTPPADGLPAAVRTALVDLLGPAHVDDGDALRRLRTAGKSTPDLLRARAGDVADAPDLVVRPADHDQVQAVLDLAVAHRVAVVPFGGGTGVVGGVAGGRTAREAGLAGALSLDLVRLDSLLALDEVSLTATLGAGLRGPAAEALLAEHGLVLGHYPQSFEHASIGGFAATRSSGQASAGYGRFDAMVVGLRAATPRGQWRLGVAPASAAGPDLRQVLLGSEGAFGVVTEVTVRVRRAPSSARFGGWRLPDFAAATTAVRTLAQEGLLPTVLRISDETETALNLADPSAVGEAASAGCLVVVDVEGSARHVARRWEEVAEVLAAHGGTDLGAGPGEAWRDGRFHGPYLRDALLDVGVLVETLETATFWSGVDGLKAAVTDAVSASLGDGTLVLCHVSHVYETGCSLYFTVAAPGGQDRAARWGAAKAAACEAIVAAGGTITHHHAVGRDHRPWLHHEVGDVGVGVLRALKAELDPTGVLNPGVLVP
ncbi:FAD-binding oxidoreductase [Nocardioides bruguierae]|uniref:FAD-binding oxidoreductase n=1 Tax=Nocardioides bruguierae TaxID=2945102 RepID=UPI002020F16E|nr:FAD-binding oxidoreductase [Nocardioides bruguierae]MCL8024101.1 FAD-binding oxidoreductase [Nocardioides bruguierae]